jgi:small conductance mechanosensitive channel
MPQDISGQQLTYFADMAWHWAEAFLPRLFAAALIFLVGFWLAGWIARQVRRLLGDVQIDPTLRPILGTVARYTIIVLVVVLGLTQLGVQTTSLLTLLGAAGLAIGLALQGTLSNIAAGIMLLWLRPFHVGDYIEVGSQASGGQSGAVEEIGLFACQLRTFDGLFLMMPNSAIWNQPLKNHTRNTGRLIGINVSVPATADLDRVRKTLVDVAVNSRRALSQPPPRVFIDNFISGSVVLTLMVWAVPQGAGDLERTIIEGAKLALDALGEGHKPMQITRTVPPDSDPSRFLEGRRA